MPFGFERYMTGSPVFRNMTPWYMDGRNPAPQFDAPPLVPFVPVENTTNAGKSLDSLPSPYVVHAPKLGRPNCWLPVFIMICPGAWLNASVCSDFTMHKSSATVARCGNNSDNSAPDCPCRANLYFGPSRVEFGLMNAARYPLSNSA